MARDTFELDVRDLGRMAYPRAAVLQRQIHTLVITGQINAPGALLLVEHEPVITVSGRRGAGENLLASKEELASRGIDLQETNRGGDITYHGPGQLVVYPIVKLSSIRMNVGRYIRMLEQIIIDTAAQWGVAAKRIDNQTGVWADMPRGPAQAAGDCGEAAKLAAIGVRVRRNVTMHGLAINIHTNLEDFETIVPCGLSNRNVTSMAQLLGDDCPSMAEVKAAVVEQCQRRLKPGGGA